MEAAAELLSKSALGLAEIGFTCGFADQAHFTRAFKRFTAFTPAAYRSDFATITHSRSALLHPLDRDRNGVSRTRR
jgi:transcriptional regulator GlxA family with amidase domain